MMGMLILNKQITNINEKRFKDSDGLYYLNLIKEFSSEANFALMDYYQRNGEFGIAKELAFDIYI